jgi:osmotically-inducible protein OsmY
MKFKKKLIMAPALALAIAAMSGVSSADTASQNITEARQETQIWTTYALNPNLRATDLKVSVHGDKATLSGTVEEGVEKELAKQIALGVSGIREVDNQIVVDPVYVMPARASQERSFGEVVDDSTVTAAVKSKLLWSKHADGLKTDVDTNRGRVTLTGTADSKAARDLAARLASNTDGVVSVDNQLTVEKTKIVDVASKKADNAGRVVSDSWITTKVKSTLMYSRWVDGSDIKVDTKNGVVTLSGQADSAAERDLAIELAQNVRGVNKVNAKGLTL